jgi:tRNA (cmo5U34)-methyltransferase
MLALARDRFPAADLRVQRLEDPTSRGTYDLVVSALTVHHLDAAGKADLFRRVHGRLRSGGRFVLADAVVPDEPDDAVTRWARRTTCRARLPISLAGSGRQGSGRRCAGSTRTSPSSPPTHDA